MLLSTPIAVAYSPLKSLDRPTAMLSLPFMIFLSPNATLYEPTTSLPKPSAIL